MPIGTASDGLPPDQLHLQAVPHCLRAPGEDAAPVVGHEGGALMAQRPDDSQHIRHQRLQPVRLLLLQHHERKMWVNGTALHAWTAPEAARSLECFAAALLQVDRTTARRPVIGLQEGLELTRNLVVVELAMDAAYSEYMACSRPSTSITQLTFGLSDAP